jgi:hypothetical protein
MQIPLIKQRVFSLSLKSRFGIDFALKTLKTDANAFLLNELLAKECFPAIR